MKKQFMKGLVASLIMALSVTTVTPAMAAEEAAPKAAESTAKASQKQDAYNAYAATIQKYKRVQDSHYDFNVINQLDVNPTLSMNLQGSNQKLYYALEDFAHDGIPELFIAAYHPNDTQYFPFTNYTNYDIYGYMNGKAYKCFPGMGYRHYYCIMQGKNRTVMMYEGSGGAYDHYRCYYTVNKNGVEPVYLDGFHEDYHAGYKRIFRMVNEFDSNSEQLISQAEYDRVASEFTFKKDIKWYPVNDLEPLKKVLLPLPSVKILLNGQELKCDQPPVIKNNRILVPFRAILEGMNAKVGWNGDTRTVTASLDGIDLSLKIGSKTMYKNGQPIILDVPAQIINNRTLIPARAVTEALGAKVDWDGNTRTVYVVQNEKPQPKPPVEDQREKDYQYALSLLNQGYSYNAYYAFQKLGNYKDCSQRMKEAKQMNAITYDSWNYAMELRNNKNFYERLNESQIQNLMPKTTWLSPGFIGYNIETYNQNGVFTGTGYTMGSHYSSSDTWYTDKNGLSYGQFPFDSNILDCYFMKISKDAYAQVVLKESYPPSDEPAARIFVDVKSDFGKACKASMDRMMNHSEYEPGYRPIKDGNGLVYMNKTDYDGNITESIPS